MKSAERDELLIQIRTTQELSFKHNEIDHQEIKEHLLRMNAKTVSTSDRVTVLETRKEVSKKSIAGYASVVAAVGVALWKSFTGQPL